MRHPENEHLVKQLRKGDVASFNIIFKYYNQKVFNFCIELLNNNKEAEEVTQEVFIALWQNRDKIELKTSLGSYIFSIARNMIYNLYRKSFYTQAYIAYINSCDTALEFVTEDEVIFNELKDFINKVVEELPVKRKEAFILSRFEGLTYKEIALKMKISENTVDVHIRNALDYIRKSFNKFY